MRFATIRKVYGNILHTQRAVICFAFSRRKKKKGWESENFFAIIIVVVPFFIRLMTSEATNKFEPLDSWNRTSLNLSFFPFARSSWHESPWHVKLFQACLNRHAFCRHTNGWVRCRKSEGRAGRRRQICESRNALNRSIKIQFGFLLAISDPLIEFGVCCAACPSAKKLRYLHKKQPWTFFRPLMCVHVVIAKAQLVVHALSLLSRFFFIDNHGTKVSRKEIKTFLHLPLPTILQRLQPRVAEESSVRFKWNFCKYQKEHNKNFTNGCIHIKSPGT